MDHNKGFDLEIKNGSAQLSGLSVWSPKSVLVVLGFFVCFLTKAQHDLAIYVKEIVKG